MFSIFASLQVGKYAEYCISSNKHWALNKCCPVISVAPSGIHIEISASPSDKRCTYKCGASQNSYYILLVAKPKYIWNQYAKKTMKILLIFRFFQYIQFIDSENLCFILFQRKNDKISTFNIINFTNFEISPTL